MIREIILRPGGASLLMLLRVFLFALVYGGVCYLLGDGLGMITLILGFGALVLLYWAIEWGITGVVVLLAGFHARWSVTQSLFVGGPVFALQVLVSLVVGSGRETMGVPVPFMAAYEHALPEIIPLFQERMIWWAGFYLAAMLLGFASRWVIKVPAAAN